MKKRYLCPHCEAVLNPNVKIVLLAKTEDVRGLMLLNAKPGDYGLIFDPEFSLEEGEMVEFACPVCGGDLRSAADPHFVEILLDLGGASYSKVEFSRIYGEHATFIIDGRQVEAFGEDAPDFEDINFFGH